VSLPRLADVVGYEEKERRVLDSVEAGYPRFFENPIIRRLRRVYLEAGYVREPTDPLLPNREAAVDLLDHLEMPEKRLYPAGDFWSIESREVDPRTVRAYLQHTGSALSSREAEAALHRSGYLDTLYPEELAPLSAEAADALIRDKLHLTYGTASANDIFLCRGGMNAFYAGFRALQAIQLRKRKDLWIQLGWLYVDTSRILEKWSLPGVPPKQCVHVADLEQLQEILRVEGRRVAGIVTEIPTNPLVQTPDIEKLRALADKYKAGLVLDPTLVSPHNVNVLQFADLHINSLTKYAAADADVMMGAVALNERSRFYDALLHSVSAFRIPPFERDLRRMAYQIPHYEANIHRVNESTRYVHAFLQAHPAIDKLFWAYTEPSHYHYNWIQHLASGPGSIISFSLKRGLSDFYDRVQLVKSPSFGARFTMLCPFLYLAHYDLVSRPEGRKVLENSGVPPDLIRLSVGQEDPVWIIMRLAEALA